MKTSLFQEFKPISAKQWKQKIQFELQGGDYNEKLVFKSLNGIHVKPFYTAEDIKEPVRVTSPKNWTICEKIYVVNAKEANKKAHNALKKGAEAIWFELPSEEIDLKILFSGIDKKSLPIYLKPEFLSEDFFNRLRNFAERSTPKIYLQNDPVGKLARSGNWFFNLNEDQRILKESVLNSGNLASMISINSALYQNAGATIPQQMAYALAHLNEYLNLFEESEGFSQVKQQFQPQFIVASGPNYFFEIAKIRALRWLYQTLAKEYRLPGECHIIARPSKRNKTLYDYNVNLLRTTTESMSAVLGGADAVYNLPYDSVYHKNNEFGDRIARNQLLVMKHEAHLDKVANAAEGTYYIESLTRELAEKALVIFKDIEAGCGFLKSLKAGTIQKKIKESAKKEQQLFDEGKLTLIGTNKYENEEDKMKAELQLFPFLKKNKRKTLLEPILERRLSEKNEEERLKKEEEKKI